MLEGRGEVKPMKADSKDSRGDIAVVEAGGKQPDLKDPQVVLSLLEADQVVAAKSRTRFGKRDLSLEMCLLLWGLRIYVVLMLMIVVVSVIRAIGGAR